MNLTEAKELIRELVRQADCDVMPSRFKATPAVRALVDDMTAQKLYGEVLDEIQTASGIRFTFI